jgi:putative Mn2+ efflux pump MntP
VDEISTIDAKMLLLGVMLLAIGILVGYVEFVYPEYFFGWFLLGLAGPLAWALFAVLIFVGSGMIYASLKSEPVPQK